MAARGEELNTRLTATDDASVVVDRLADKVGDLEDQPHDVDLDADTTDAERHVSELDRRLDGLTSEQRRVVLEVAARNAQRDIDKFTRDLANAQKLTDKEIELRVEARDNATRKLDAIQSEIREIDGASPTVEVDVDASRANRELGNFEGKLGDLASKVQGLGALGAAGGVAAVAAGFALVANEAAKAAVEVENTARLTGDSVEQTSRLVGVWTGAGFEVNDLQDVLLQMNGVLSSNAGLAAQLGINLNDGASLGERFLQVSAALDKIPDAALRSQIASQAFGEEGVRQFNAVEGAVGDLTTAVENYNGKVFSQEEIDRAREFQAELSKVQTQIDKIVKSYGTDLIPVLGDTLSALQKIKDVGFGDDLPASVQAAGSTLRALIDPLSVLLDQYEGIKSKVDGLIPSEKALTDGLFAQAQAVIDLDAALNADRSTAIGGVRELGTTAAEVRREFEAARQATEGFTTNLDGAGATARDVAGDLDFAALAADGLKGSLQGVADAATLFDAARAEIAEEEFLLDLADQADRVAAAQVKVGEAAKEGGAQAEIAARNHRRELLRLEDMLITLVEKYDDIPAEKLTVVRAAIDSGDIGEIESALDGLTRNRFISIDAVVGAVTSAFTSAAFRIAPGVAPTLGNVAATAAPNYVNSPTTIVHYPVGTSPTSVTVDGRTYDRRNGAR